MSRKRNRKKGTGSAFVDSEEYRSKAIPAAPLSVDATSTSDNSSVPDENDISSLIGRSFEAVDLTPGVALVPIPVPTTSPLAASGGGGSSAPPLSCLDFELLLNTYLSAKQISWSVQNQSSTVVSREAGSYSNRKSYNETYCLDPGNYTFIINDPGGKGLRAPYGNYTVKLANEILREGGGYFNPVRNNQSTDFAVPALPENFTADDSLTLTSSAADNNTTTADTTTTDKFLVEPNSPLFCRFQIILHTDEHGNQTSWNVVSVSKNMTVLSKEVGTYSDYATYNETYCFQPDNYTFTIYDAGNNGLLPPYGNYTVQVAGKKIRQGGGNFDSFKKKQSTPFSITMSSLSPGPSTTSRPSSTINPSSSALSTPSRPSGSSRPIRSPNTIKAPTQRLTDSPTTEPTVPRPSHTPTEKPTSHPTMQPTTSRPTKAPSQKPTVHPTQKPTKNPTSNPTPSPTKTPTRSPSRHPSKSPSASPSLQPSISTVPSKRPSKSPTRLPSLHPSHSPTIAPTPYSSYFETEALIILSNVNGTMNETTKMIFRAVTQDFLQSNLPKEGAYKGYSCNITLLDVCSQTTSLSADSNVFIKSYNRSFTIDGRIADGVKRRKLSIANDTQNLLVCLRIGGDLHPYNPGAQFIFPEYVLHGFEEDYRGYAFALSSSGQTVFSVMKDSPSARIFGGPEWAVPTAILLAAASVFFLACAFCCCFFWRSRQKQSKVGQRKGEGTATPDGPTGERPKPSVIMFPAEVSNSFVRSEDHNREQREIIPTSLDHGRIPQNTPHGKNPFSESFDEASREEEIPLVPIKDESSEAVLNREQEEEIPLVPIKDESSETVLKRKQEEEIPLVHEEEENGDSSEEYSEDRDGELKSMTTSSTEDDNRSITTSSSQSSQEEESDGSVRPVNEFKGKANVADEVGSIVSEKVAVSETHSMAASSSDDEYEHEHKSKRYGLKDVGDSPTVGNQEDFIVIDEKPFDSRLAARRRLFKSRLGRP